VWSPPRVNSRIHRVTPERTIPNREHRISEIV
jgi:hypothetical protein